MNCLTVYSQSTSKKNQENKKKQSKISLRKIMARLAKQYKNKAFQKILSLSKYRVSLRNKWQTMISSDPSYFKVKQDTH